MELENETLCLPARQIVADKGRVADFVAREIRREASRFDGDSADDGERPITGRDLHQAAVAMTVRLIELLEVDPGGDGAYIAEEELPGLAPLVLLRAGLPQGRRRAAAAHEIAHHIQRTRVARALYGAETVTCRDLDGRAIRHEIARTVERLVGE